MGLDASGSPPFSISVISDDPTIVQLKGELDMATAPELGAFVEVLMAAGEREVLLDLCELEFMDSQGINALLHAREALRAQGGRLTIRSPQRLVARVLETTGVLELFVAED